MLELENLQPTATIGKELNNCRETIRQGNSICFSHYLMQHAPLLPPSESKKK